MANRDPIWDWLADASDYAPAAGQVAGGLYGGAIGALAGLPGGPATMIPGAAAGAALGGSLGGGLGGLAGLWGDQHDAAWDEYDAGQKQARDESDADAFMKAQAEQLKQQQKEQAEINKKNALIDLMARFI